MSLHGFMNLPNQPPIVLDAEGRSTDYPLFTRVSIETLSFCNRDCVFCPLHWSQKERGHKRMSDELFGSLVGQLDELEFDGVVQMFLLSEPTIDKSMHDKLAALRGACPRVTLYASTNGDVFEQKVRTRGMDAAIDHAMSYFDAGLTVMNINIYDGADPVVYKAIYNAMLAKGCETTDNKYRRHPVKRRFVELTDMRVEANGGQSLTNVLYIKTKAERAHITAPQIHCARPHRHIVVEYDGNVPICCAVDVTDKSLPSMGDANTQDLLTIWNSPAMNRYRWKLQQKQRVLPGCDTCTHRMAFPAIVQKVLPPEGLWP